MLAPGATGDRELPEHAGRYRDRTVRDRRGALRQPVGPRFPAGISRCSTRSPRSIRACRGLPSPPPPTGTRATTSSRGCGLGGERAYVSEAGFDRPNIRYTIVERTNQKKQLLDFLSRHKADSGIVYCLSRNKVDTDRRLAQRPKACGALPYHVPGWTRADRAAGTRTPSCAKAALCLVATVAFAAWASTSQTSVMSRISICRLRLRPTTRRPAALAATDYRPRPG